MRAGWWPVNTPDFRSAGFRQVGGKTRQIGHPLPGISVRIVDPETQAPLAAGQPGLLLVRGRTSCRVTSASRKKPPKFCAMAGTPPATWRRLTRTASCKSRIA